VSEHKENHTGNEQSKLKITNQYMHLSCEYLSMIYEYLVMNYE